MEKINAFVNNFKSVVVIIVASLLVFGFALSRVIPVVQNITKYDADYKSAETSLSDKKHDSTKHADIYIKIDEDIKAIYKLIDEKRIKG